MLNRYVPIEHKNMALKSECEMCGSTDRLELHHIKPIALGGTNRPENLQTLCHDCHMAVHKIMKIPRERTRFAVAYMGNEKIIKNTPAGLRRLGVDINEVRYKMQTDKKNREFLQKVAEEASR